MTEIRQPQAWQVEIARQLSLDLDGIVRYNGRTAAEVLAEKDEGRVFCTRQGSRRWEGREVRGRREGRWRFFEDDRFGLFLRSWRTFMNSDCFGLAPPIRKSVVESIVVVFI